MKYTADELKLLAYPENKPEQDGTYWVHTTIDDGWQIERWFEVSHWSTTVDYFIPYRLDEPVSDTDELEPFTDESLLLELINRNVLGEASSVTERCVLFNEVVVGIGNDEVAYITFPKEAFGALCDLVYKPLGNSEQLEREMKQSDKRTVEYTIELYSHWLKEQGYDVTEHIDQPPIKGRTLWNDIHIEICDLDGFDDTFMIASVTNPERYVFVTDKQLKQCHKAVKERKPEIKACPNPECRGKCELKHVYHDIDHYWVKCKICDYCSPTVMTESEAIRLHNLITDNSRRNDARDKE